MFKHNGLETKWDNITEEVVNAFMVSQNKNDKKSIFTCKQMID